MTTPVKPLSILSRGLLCLFPVVLGVAVWYGATSGLAFLSQEPSGPYGDYAAHYNPQPVSDAPPDGAALFARHCAYCHGSQGRGDGIARVEPAGRYFGREKFKLASTDNAMPTDDDLNRVMEHGIPGSAMPAFPQLTPADRTAVIAHLRQLIWPGVYERVKADIKKSVEQGGEEFDPKNDWKPAELTKKTDELTQIGAVLPLPATFETVSVESLAKGRIVFEKTCANCHGPKGEGDGPQVKDPKFVNDNGTKAYPRNLTAGVYKGGGEPEHLYRRIALGIPGTPMPASLKTVPQEDILHLINYVKSIVKTEEMLAGK